MAALLLLAVLMVLMACAMASPNHDDLQAQTPIYVARQEYSESGLSRRLSALAPVNNATSSTSTNTTTTTTTLDYNSCQFVHSQAWRPIRIGFTIVDEDGVVVASALKDHVRSVLMPRAISYLEQTLRVRSVVGLHADQIGTVCSSNELTTTTTTTTSTSTTSTTSTTSSPARTVNYTNTTSTSTNTTSTTSAQPVNMSTTTKFATYTCASKAPTCGSDRVPIPSAYLSGHRVCSNCSNPWPAVHQGAGDDVCDGCTMEPHGVEAHGFDFVALITIRDTASCTGTIKAYSSSCVRDQCDRPIFGALNFCGSRLSLDVSETWRQVSLLIHEFTHMLAFSSTLFKYFRNANGTPRIPREGSDESKVMGEVPWSCTSASTWSYPDASQDANRVHVDLVARGLVGEYSERGISSCGCPVGSNNSGMSSGCLVPVLGFRSPTCVMKLQTPKVVEMVRQHFDCSSLQGAELENQGSKCTIFNSHWEQRIFMGELMTSSPEAADVFVSKVTLAVFEDSGWYLPTYAMADFHVKGANWGYHQGCGFALDRCVTSGVSSSPRHWCATNGGRACTLDRKSEALCVIQTFPSIPSAVSYFPVSTHAGSLPELDYCPFHQTPVSNHVCTSTSSLPMPDGTVNFMREVFGSTSRCFDSTLHGDVSAHGGGGYTANPSDFTDHRPGCFDVSCSADAASYTVTVADFQVNPASTMTLGTCHSEGQTLTTASLQGQVICADPAEICLPYFIKHYLRWSTTTTTSTTNITSTVTTTTSTSTISTSTSTDPNATRTTDPNSTTVTTSTSTTSTLTTSTSTSTTTSTLTTTSTNTTLTTNVTTTVTTYPNSTTTSTTSTTTTSTTTTTTLPPPPPPPKTTTTVTTITTTTTTSTTTTSTTSTSTTTNTTTSTTTTTPVILWVEGSMSIIVYDLASVPYFVHDMKTYEIFENTIAGAVFGVTPSMVEVINVFATSAPEGDSSVPGHRLLQFLPRELPPEEMLPTPAPAPRWLQGGLTLPPYEVVRQPTPLEKSGVKPDGKAGGPQMNHMDVFFRILVGDDKEVAHRALREFATVATEAMTFMLEAFMESIELPRIYTIAIVAVDAYPAVTEPEFNTTNASITSKVTSTSLAASHFRLSRLLFFSVSLPWGLIGAVTAAHAIHWL